VDKINVNSCSGFILTWITYQGIKYATAPELYPQFDSFIFAGILILPITFAPIFLLIFYYIFLDQHYYFPNMTGLLCGYCLGFGMDSLLQNTYWTFWFLFNFAIFLVLSQKLSSTDVVEQQALFRGHYQVDENAHNVLIIDCLEIPQPTTSNITLPSHLQNRGDIELTEISNPRVVNHRERTSDSVSPAPRNNIDQSLTNTNENPSHDPDQSEEFDEEALQPLLNRGQIRRNEPKIPSVSLNWRGLTPKRKGVTKVEETRNNDVRDEDDEDDETSLLTKNHDSNI
jgi:hypothetical protein